MWKAARITGRLAMIGVVLGSVAACDQPTRTITEIQTRTDTLRIVRTDTVRVGNPTLVFNQIERLGNPLVSEVMLEKRLHGFHNTTNPRTDVRNFRDDLVRFVTNVAGRDQAYARAVADALLPDMLLVFPNRAPGVTAANADASGLVGWLTFALAPNNTGYGGRKLDNDDAVDKGLSVIFGAALGNTNNVSPGLTTDNVPDPRQEPKTFPYLAAPF
jgi:hypothetical protein